MGPTRIPIEWHRKWTGSGSSHHHLEYGWLQACRGDANLCCGNYTLYTLPKTIIAKTVDLRGKRALPILIVQNLQMMAKNMCLNWWFHSHKAHCLKRWDIIWISLHRHKGNLVFADRPTGLLTVFCHHLYIWNVNASYASCYLSTK